MPFRFGIAISITATSGFAESVRSTASLPSPASATTVNPGWRSSRTRRPHLMTVWSSASKIRTGFIFLLSLVVRVWWKRDGDYRSAADLRLNPERAIQMVDALLHSKQTDTPLHLRSEAATV